MKIKTCFSQNRKYLGKLLCKKKKKIHKYDAGHMNNVATMSIYGNSPSKSFSSEPAD